MGKSNASQYANFGSLQNKSQPLFIISEIFEGYNIVRIYFKDIIFIYHISPRHYLYNYV